jgi:DNA-binding response OmpR family regulator
MNHSEPRRILLIDNDRDLLTRLKTLLTDEGYDATTAWGGSEALGLLGSKRFDLILLSDHLPDINARELWCLLRKLPSDADHALIKGSDPLIEDVRALLRQYADHCILPRTTPAQLASAVTRCLLRQKA